MHHLIKGRYLRPSKMICLQYHSVWWKHFMTTAGKTLEYKHNCITPQSSTPPPLLHLEISFFIFIFPTKAVLSQSQLNGYHTHYTYTYWIAFVRWPRYHTNYFTCIRDEIFSTNKYMKSEISQHIYFCIGMYERFA